MAVIAFLDRKYKYHGTVSSHAQEHEVETTGECYKIAVLKNRNLTITTFMRHLKSYFFSQY